MPLDSETVCEREAPVTRSVPEAPLSYVGSKLRGYAVVYGVQSVGPVEVAGKYLPEVIDAGAFDDSLKSGKNISFTFQHADESEYGDTQSGSLRLLPDERGIAFSLDLPAYARTLKAKIEQGLIRGMSFGFVPKIIEVRNGVRHIVKADLVHISSVYSPAYSATTVSVVRCHSLATKRRKLDLLKKS